MEQDSGIETEQSSEPETEQSSEPKKAGRLATRWDQSLEWH